MLWKIVLVNNACTVFLVLFVWFLLGSAISTTAQDSLIFKNNDYVTGEIKGMDKGVLTIETAYSKVDFTIEWSEVKQIYTETNFMVTQVDGDRFSGTLKSEDGGQVSIINGGSTSTHNLIDIVLLKSVSDKFWDKVNAAISLGFSLTRAQSLKQFTSRSSVGYVSERWSLGFIYNTLRSTQDDVENVQRNDGGVTFNYFLPNDWFIPASISFLSNTEQKLDLRLLEKLGIGKYVIHTNRAYWGFSLGANYNAETFTDETPDRKSWEAFVGTQLNIFDIEDLTLLTTLVAYPSLTESGRIRSDLGFDMKYEFPYDFFIQLGLTVNYDNRPVNDAPDTDYVFQTTFGWSW